MIVIWCDVQAQSSSRKLCIDYKRFRDMLFHMHEMYNNKECTSNKACLINIYINAFYDI